MWFSISFNVEQTQNKRPGCFSFFFFFWFTASAKFLHPFNNTSKDFNNVSCLFCFISFRKKNVFEYAQIFDFDFYSFLYSISLLISNSAISTALGDI